MPDIPLPQPGKPSPPKADLPAMPEEASVHDKIVAAIKQVYDPEIPVNVYELGLIYRIEIDESTGNVEVDMTLTSANCPEAQTLPAQVRQEVLALPEVSACKLNLVWEPAWDKERMSDEAKLHLGLM